MKTDVTTPTQAIPIDPIVRRSTLALELGQSTTTIWRWSRDNYLPKPIKLGQTTGWPRSVIDKWKIEQGWPADGGEK